MEEKELYKWPLRNVVHVMRIQGQVLLTQLGQVPQITPVTVLLKAKQVTSSDKITQVAMKLHLCIKYVYIYLTPKPNISNMNFTFMLQFFRLLIFVL